MEQKKQEGSSRYGEAGVDGRPVKVIINRAFEIGKYEVTQKQWFDVMDITPPISAKKNDDAI